MPDDLDRRLDQWASAQAAPASSGVENKVREMLGASLRPVKPLPPKWALVVAFANVFLIGAGFLLFFMQDDGFHLMKPWQMVLTTGVFSAAIVLFASYLAASMVPGSRQGVSLKWALPLSAVGFAAITAALFPWRIPRAFVAEGWPCALMELEVAALAAVVFLTLARRGAIFPSPGLGAAFGGISAFFALTVQQYQCMFQQAPHLLIWHGGMAALLVAAGALLGAFLEKRRAA